MSFALAQFHEGGEVLRLSDGHVGEHLSVDVDTSIFQTVHELGISYTVNAARRTDAGDPEAAHISFSFAAMEERVAQGVNHRFMGTFEDLVPAGAMTCR